jgi:hypothetical protein
MRRWVGIALALLVTVCVQVAALPARAHPVIDDARARVEAAEFDAALRVLAEAEARSDLTRADALRLLELRALVRLALKERERARESLRMLAVLSPDHVFPPHTSPDLVAEFKRVQAGAPPPPRLGVERMLRPDGVRLLVRVSGDELDLTRSVRLWTRVGGQPWRSTLATETIVLAGPGERVTYRAEVQGFGGAPLFETPEQALSIPQAHDDPPVATAGTSPWVYAGAAAGVLVVAGVAAMLLLSAESDVTRVSPPRVVAP